MEPERTQHFLLDGKKLLMLPGVYIKFEIHMLTDTLVCHEEEELPLLLVEGGEVVVAKEHCQLLRK